MRKIPVLIIGGGPVGLSTALALARQRIETIVIEQHPGTTTHPRARGVNVRTMELFRQWGNDVELSQFEQPKEARRFIWIESLQGKEITRVVMEDTLFRAFSPTQASLVSQDHVENSLYHALQHYSEASLEFSKECIAVSEDETGINATILDKKTHQEEKIHAQYLIAADGVQSRIRKQLGIAMEGEKLGQFCSVHCEMDISQWTKHRPSIGFFFTDIKLGTRFLASVDGKNRWIIGLRFTPDNTKADFTNEFCIAEIRRLVNSPTLDVHIINKNFWTMGAQLADHFRKGRIFLAGDAAHRLPPTGGFGMNTGIQDAHNLAWKLAFVLKYQIPDSLLDSYSEERAPIAKQNMNWSTENAKHFSKIYEAIFKGDMEQLQVTLSEQQKNLNYSGLDLGFIYHSSVVISENQQTISVTPSQYVPTTLPGSRAPHVLLIKNQASISTLDLFENDLVLLIGSEGQAWEQAVREISPSLPLPLKSYRIAADGDLNDPENRWQTTYEITSTGAVLIRPDGHVAWRSKALVSDSKQILSNIINKLFDL